VRKTEATVEENLVSLLGFAGNLEILQGNIDVADGQYAMKYDEFKQVRVRTPAPTRSGEDAAPAGSDIPWWVMVQEFELDAVETERRKQVKNEVLEKVEEQEVEEEVEMDDKDHVKEDVKEGVKDEVKNEVKDEVKDEAPSAKDEADEHGGDTNEEEEGKESKEGPNSWDLLNGTIEDGAFSSSWNNARAIVPPGQTDQDWYVSQS